MMNVVLQLSSPPSFPLSHEITVGPRDMNWNSIISYSANEAEKSGKTGT